MSNNSVEEDKLRALEYRKIDRKRVKLRKDEDLFETVEEVFDYSTLMALYELINRGVIDEMFGAVSAGKESRVYWAKARDGSDLAVKIYLTASREFRKSIQQYIRGDPRFLSIRKDSRHLIYTWAQKEFKNLEEAFNAKVNVPKPIRAYKNILVMSFIGEEGVPAPLIKDYPPEDPDKAYRTILEFIKRLYRQAKIVHADLSEYNILNWKGSLYIIDFGQAVSIAHPMSATFLTRDIRNVNRFFSSLGVKVVPLEEAFKWVTAG